MDCSLKKRLGDVLKYSILYVEAIDIAPENSKTELFSA